MQEVLAEGDLRDLFRPRFTSQDVVEFEQLKDIIAGVNLGHEADERSCFFEDNNQRLARLASGLVYKASVQGDHDFAGYSFVWKNFAPLRVKFFGWLLTKGRVHCRTSLVRKNIIDDASCALCHAADQTMDHIFYECSFVQSFWAAIGWLPPNVAKKKELWESCPPPHVAKKALPPAPSPLLGNLEA